MLDASSEESECCHRAHPSEGSRFSAEPRGATVRDAELVLGNFYPVLSKKVSIVSFCPSAEMARIPYLSDMSVLARNLHNGL